MTPGQDGRQAGPVLGSHDPCLDTLTLEHTLPGTSPSTPHWTTLSSQQIATPTS